MNIRKVFATPQEVQAEIQRIMLNYPMFDQVLLFGSRARMDAKYNSDFDLCVVAPKDEKKAYHQFVDEIQEMNTPFSFDLVFFSNIASEVFKAEILKDGLVL